MHQIPIRNLYYLFLYAWDHFTEGRSLDVGREFGPDIPNLLSRVLVSGVQNLLRRGLDRGYKEQEQVTAYPRGRILVYDSVKRNSVALGRLACCFDELEVDTPHNRILKAGLRKLSRYPGTNPELVVWMLNLEKRMAGVRLYPLSRALFRPLQLTRNSGNYGLLMHVCHMALDLSLPDEHGTGSRFVDILDDEVRMSSIFEKFVRNFYQREQNIFSVRSEVVSWDAENLTSEQAGYLPLMITDLTLRSSSRTIVLDTKFYPQVLVSRYGGQPKIRSDHLYQLQAYIRNMERKGGTDGTSEGILLYPSNGGSDVRLDMRLAGHRMRVWTLDLSRPWKSIHDQLLQLIETQ